MALRLLALVLLSGLIAVAAPQRFASGPDQVHLIELFTSEGCSSCPPAEAWLNGLRSEPGLWRDFVPMAFHVNYWDRLGWPDRLATRQFTDRQYRYGSVWGVSTVYTPGFVLDGRDWRERSGRRLPKAGGPAGKLSVEIAAAHCQVHFEPVVVTIDPLEVHVALLGSGFESKVLAGENRGRTLVHEFVVLNLATHPLQGGRVNFVLPTRAMEGGGRRSLAIWVTRAGAVEPLQATGGWLD